MTKTPAILVPRPAATVILARDCAGGIEVFMMQRTHGADFIAGAFVFPGGAVDPADFSVHASACCIGLDDAEASRRLGLKEGGLAYWVAAIRECFEEAGLLLACNGQGGLIELKEPATIAQFSERRNKLNAGEQTMADICSAHDLRLAADKLVYFSHWTTPVFAPRRYDTRFFVATAPTVQTPSHDNSETIDHLWIRPADALARQRTGEFKLAFATVRTLQTLAGFQNTQALLDYAHALTAIPAWLAWPATGRKGRRMLLQEDAAYAEVRKLDPVGTGDASCELMPGVVTRLSNNVRRIAAPDTGVSTRPAVHTYLLGQGDDISVIDPGTSSDSDVQHLLEQAEGRIHWILVTHAHGDQLQSAVALKERTGAALLGMPSSSGDGQAQRAAFDRVLADGERLTVAGCSLRVLHVPAHPHDRLCYLLEEEQILFTGGHVVQGPTAHIAPPGGDHHAYLASLRALQAEDIAYLAPGRGFLIDKPRERISRLLG